ncbi:MAG: hypothetical protein KAS23_06165, partial [Anaerohalosphaera sp.]|nr:hypothetical protein [Anaerohalosphaera sp.]
MKNTTGNTEAGSRAVSKNKRIVRTGLLVAAVVLLCFLVLMIINRPRQADYEVLYLPFSDVMNISASGISEDFNCFINDKGQVAGNYRQGGKVNISYLWDEKNGLVELAVVKDKYCFIQDINNKGQAVGYVSDIDYNGWHGECEAFFMDTDRTITLLPIDEDAGAYACGINDKGVVVGLIYLAPFHQFELEKNKQVFVWDKVGGMRIIDEIGDDVEFVCGINRAGQIAGLLKGEESGYDAFSWSESGGFVSLDVEAEWICDINEEGSILGITYFEEELFVWDEDNGVELLDAKGDWVDGCGMNDAA